MSTVFSGIIAIISCTSFSVVGLWFLKNTPKLSKLNQHQQMAGTILSVVGTLFSVLIGFLVATTLHSYENASMRVDAEANRLADIFILSRGLPESERRSLRDTCRKYCMDVIDEEWPAMRRNNTSPKAWADYYTLWDETLSVPPGDVREANLHQAMLAAMQGLGENRRSRIASLRGGMSPALWAVATSGSVIVVVITYVLATEASFVPCMITALVTASLGLNIFLLAAYSSPFSGDLGIMPHGFLLDRELFSQNDDPASYLKVYSGQGKDASPDKNQSVAPKKAVRPSRASKSTVLIKSLKITP